MKLKQLFKGIEGVEIRGSKDTELTGISTDSRIISPGQLFLAKQGISGHGVDFISHALDSGAAAILTDLYDPFVKVPQIIAPDPGALEALLASKFYGDPSQELYVVGITGTKGKTTTSYMVHHLLQELGFGCGLVGTVETIVGAESRSSTLTTHSSSKNQKLFREMVLRACHAVALEVSSHGLEQGRTENIAFDCAIFTNLTPDHLDYHQSVEKYATVKRKLFEQLDESPKKNKRALINADSDWASFVKGRESTWTFGLERPADISASHLRTENGQTHFVVAFAGHQEAFMIPVMGRFNVYNTLGAIGVGLHRGAGLSQIAAAMRSFRAAPGRLEPIANDRGLSIFVDYAHTGEALENVLKTLREIAQQKIICIFGCGGNRDPQRRMNMAKAAEQYADVAIITSDNPRGEDPMAICQEILAGFRDSSFPRIEVDRRAAIHLGLDLAQAGDIVLIAGKGHEKVQILARQTIAFDDCAVVREALQM
ncbi:MAG TPA: UDP-N-acetylmuramoyl-L-alanyl-D-glutamate--2,6-diaminopimelate ligase [Chlamydiales bacterium]|nr:UDP-N-acetylmuramoyl-L-alanyl-D-glutamate--2,6-diaminopimelate ligase [Chlamydiales bacterium]